MILATKITISDQADSGPGLCMVDPKKINIDLAALKRKNKSDFGT